MSEVRIHVLGALKVTRAGQESATLPRSARRLIGLMVAAGSSGIDRDDLAHELWGDPLPDSWMSALRNRVTAARKVLGQDKLLTDGGRFRFADSVSIDSWEILTHSLRAFAVQENEMAFLEGEPLSNLQPSPLVTRHVDQVCDARASLVQATVGRRRVLSPLALQSLRGYRSRHPTSAAVTIETIRAHVHAGRGCDAANLVAEAKAWFASSPTATPSWVDELDQLLDTHEDHATTTSTARTTLIDPQARAELFDRAAEAQDWSLAYEIATAGLPAAARPDGDPERLVLLHQIPYRELDPNRRFNYCLIMTRQCVFAARDDDAHVWSRRARALAQTPNQELQAFIMVAVVGDLADERTPALLPTSFDSAPDESVSMQSLQVVVMSHLERAAFEDAEPLRTRFVSLVEASADPYRRWHLLLLESMTLFVAGDIRAAAEAATHAFKYGELFGIVDALNSVIGQRSNAHWVHAGFPGIEDYPSEYPGSTDLQLVRALHAISITQETGAPAVDDFLRSYNFRSRSFLTVPTVALLAPHIVDDDLRATISQRLLTRTGTSAIWGTGVLHLGPVDRIVAKMSTTKVEREMHLIAAVHVADRQRTRLWQVVTRLDLAASTGNPQWRQQARELATTVELSDLVADYVAVF